MYAILLKAHVGLAVLALALTLGWAAIVAATTAAPGRASRLAYIGAIASTGLVGVTGVVAAFAGGFATMAFPGFGLVAVAGHGLPALAADAIWPEIAKTRRLPPARRKWSCFSSPMA